MRKQTNSRGMSRHVFANGSVSLAVAAKAEWRVRFYSYRRASTGSSFDARSAGTRPLITPTTSSTAVESDHRHHRDVQMDIALAGIIFKQRPHQRQGADGAGDEHTTTARRWRRRAA